MKNLTDLNLLLQWPGFQTKSGRATIVSSRSPRMELGHCGELREVANNRHEIKREEKKRQGVQRGKD